VYDDVVSAERCLCGAIMSVMVGGATSAADFEEDKEDDDPRPGWVPKPR
jgi:hypothetical protein